MRRTIKKKINPTLILPRQAILKPKKQGKQNDELLQSIIDNTPSLIFTKDLDGRFTMVNRKFASFFQTTPEHVIGKTVYDLCPPDFADEYTATDRKTIDEERTIEVREDSIIRGNIRHFYSVRFPLHDDKGEVCGLGGISTDITDYVSAEKLAKQKQILDTTIQAQEKERMEIGLELHDNVTQLLATAKILINAAIAMPYKIDECLSKSKDFIMRALKELRDISHSMLPPPLEDKAFVDSVREFGKTMKMSGAMDTEVQLPSTDDIRLLPQELKLSIYRIIQEQVNNIIKHSQATKMRIHLKVKNNVAELMVDDNGKGIQSDSRPKGIGLKNIENRVKMMNGTLEIKTGAGKGFKLMAKFPL